MCCSFFFLLGGVVKIQLCSVAAFLALRRTLHGGHGSVLREFVLCRATAGEGSSHAQSQPGLPASAVV